MTIYTAFLSWNKVDRLYVSRKEKEEGSPAFKIASMHRFRLKNYIKNAEEDWLQPLETRQTTPASKEQKARKDK